MPNINYVWQGITGAVVFPDGVGLHDASLFEVSGYLELADVVAELDCAQMFNRENIVIALEYSDPVTPWQVMNAASLLGWVVTLSAELQAEFEQWDSTENLPPEDGAF
jgi:hypothetical protein